MRLKISRIHAIRRKKKQAIVPYESTGSDLGRGAPSWRKAAIIRTTAVRSNCQPHPELN